MKRCSVLFSDRSQYVRKVREFLTTLRIGKQQLLWPVQSDNTPRNWIRKALTRKT